MKLAIGYSTKDQVDLTKQSLLRLGSGFELYWCDGSATEEGKAYFEKIHGAAGHSASIYGGADAAIVWKLSTLLDAPEGYTHIGLLENDVLLDPDWLEPTMALFELGARNGLDVGCVSPRSYVDRVLIQRDGYAVMHNVGAGAAIFTREAAEVALRTFRTGYWPDNRQVFAQLCGIDIGMYAAFRFNDQNVTSDWHWEVALAQRGLACLALTPSKADMIGQNPPLRDQGLELTTGPVEARRDDAAFGHLKYNLNHVRSLRAALTGPGLLRKVGEATLFFPHQVGMLNATLSGNWRLKWTQGWGPFSYRAGPGGASLSVHIAGSGSYHLSGGEAGAGAVLTDTRSGFRAEPMLPANQMITVTVPGNYVPRQVRLELAEGAVFHGLETQGIQLLDPTYRFDYSVLPEV